MNSQNLTSSRLENYSKDNFQGHLPFNFSKNNSNFLINNNINLAQSNLTQKIPFPIELKEDFKMVHWNANSIRHRISFFNMYLQKEKPDVFLLNETRLHNMEEANKLFSNAQYNHFSLTREKNSGGGVSILISKKFKCERIELPANFKQINLEMVMVKLFMDDHELILVSYYNAPDKALCKEIFDFLDKQFDFYLLIGDLNAHLTTYGAKKCNKIGKQLEEALMVNNCLIINESGHTFEKERKSKKNGKYKYTQTLDFAIASIKMAYKLQQFEVEFENNLLKSDHGLVKLTFNAGKFDRAFFKKEKTFLFEKADWYKFSEQTNQFESSGFSDLSLEQKYEKIVQKLLEAKENCIPLFKRRADFGKINLNDELVTLKRKRNKAQRYFKKIRSQEARIAYYNLNYEFHQKLTIFLSSKWTKFCKQMKNKLLSTKEIWRKIKIIQNSNNNQNDIPTLTNDKNEKLKTCSEKAEAFANRLEKVFDDDETNCFDENWYNLTAYHVVKAFENSNESEKKIFEMEELNLAIRNLSNKNSNDADNITTSMLKRCGFATRKALLEMFNESLCALRIPSKWKTSVITMLHKKGPKSEISNYRPISITLAIARLYEKLITARVNLFLTQKRILIKNQSGFRNNRQTKDNIIQIIQKALEAKNGKKKVVLLTYDIHAAFDHVNHTCLIFKLLKTGLPIYLCRWINEFLKDRKFQVKINNKLSTMKSIRRGTPQGCIISPICFNVYINDIPLVEEVNGEMSLLFADDLGDLFIADEINSRLKWRIEMRLNKLETWFFRWRLTLATNKCNYIIFSQNKKTKEQIDLSINGKEIKLEDQITFLGIRFDKFLSFKYQVQYIKDTCQKRINALKVIKYGGWKLSDCVLLNIYKTLVRSVIDYSLFFFSILSPQAQTELQTIQNDCIRIIFNIKLNDKVSVVKLHEMSKLEKLDERADILLNNYIEQAQRNNNQLTCNLINEYKQSIKEKNDIVSRTLLEKVNLEKISNDFDGICNLFQEKLMF